MNRQDLARQMRLLVRHIRFSPLTGPNRSRRLKLLALKRLFVETNRWLARTGAEYWLVYGTLLGQFREGAILPHDTDIDLGAHEKDFHRILGHRHLLPPGFRLFDTSRRHKGPKLYVCFQGWEADIYFYRENDGMLRSYENSRNLGEITPFPKSWIYPLAPVEFLGEKTLVPNRPRAYLEHVYRYIGPDAVQDKATGYWYARGERRGSSPS